MSRRLRRGWRRYTYRGRHRALPTRIGHVGSLVLFHDAVMAEVSNPRHAR